MEKRKIPWQGELADAQPLEFKSGGENWNEYWLSDGTTIRFKSVVVDVVRVDGKYDAEGNPIYLVKSQNIVAVNAPENLRKPL